MIPEDFLEIIVLTVNVLFLDLLVSGYYSAASVYVYSILFYTGGWVFFHILSKPFYMSTSLSQVFLS